VSTDLVEIVDAAIQSDLDSVFEGQGRPLSGVRRVERRVVYIKASRGRVRPVLVEWRGKRPRLERMF
jgi:hypothetical protein